MSKVVRAVAGLGIAAVGYFLLPAGGLSSGLISFGLSMTAGALLSLAAGGPGKEERLAAETTQQVDESPRQVGFGRFATGGSLKDAFNYGGDNDTDWEVLLLDLVDHECDALEGFYVGDEYHTFTGDGDVAGFNGQLKVYFLPGTETQTWPSIVTANWPGYSATDNSAGVTCVAVAYKADEPEQANPMWTAGRPSFLWVLRGMKCYQARKDDTVPGGSGDHRWDDPSTWEWTQNLAECRYQFQRGIYALNRIDQPDQLLLGRGLSEVEAPPERSIAYAALCDEDVDLNAGGTEKRYTFNGMIGADENFLTAESYFAEACGGVIRQPEGGIEVEPGAPQAVVAEISDADILNLEEVEYSAFRGDADSEWINTVAPRYVEPAQRYKMLSAPHRRDNADVIADGGPRPDTPDLKHVTSGTQAQRIGEIRRRLGRLLKTATLSLGPRFAELEEGDWIGWTSARFLGGARVVFRIESFERDKMWRMKLELREIAAEVYDWDETTDELVSGAVAIQQTGPAGAGAPIAGDWLLTGGLSSGQPALTITGVVLGSYATGVRFEYRLDGDTDWIPAGDHGRSITLKVIAPLAPSTDYEVALSYLFANGAPPSARTVLGPATTGDPSA